jgi:uncharacterized membrane protein
MVEYTELVPVVLRWLHVAAGITWIGLLYFFNLVNVPAMKQLDAPTRQRVITTLTPRALWWFRWSAAFTVFFGLLLMDNMARAAGGWSAFAERDSGKIIMLGGLIGFVMFLNVWLIIWPNQRKIIQATAATLNTGAPAAPEQARWARQAFLASRTNFVLSLPMLTMMVSSGHYGDPTITVVLGAIAAAGGLIWVWYLGQPSKAASTAPAAAAAPPPSK